MRRVTCILTAVVCLLCSGTIAAQESDVRAEVALAQKRANAGPNAAVPMPLDARLVTFNFDRDYDYPVLMRPFTMVHLEFAPGETLKGYYASDTSASRWTFKPARTKRDLFVMSKGDNLLNTATIITNLRTYQVTFVSASKGSYYKRVNWTGDADQDLASAGLDTFGGNSAMPSMQNGPMAASEWEAPGPAARRPAPSGRSDHDARPADIVDISKANFDYRIDGVAPFKPAMVFDDGKFTWIQLPSDVQEIPAIFALGADGTAELVNFTVRRNYFVVQRLFPDGALLKLRKDEVRVFNRRGKACGLFGCGVSGVKNLNNATYQ